MPYCKICKTKFTPRFFLQKTCETPSCIIEWSKIVRAKKEEKEWKERKKELKVGLYPKEDKGTLQKEVNKLARMIDARFGYQCIDLCGKPYGEQIDACHFHSSQSHKHITFNLHNLQSGRSDCNKYSPTHISGYYEGLIERYGKEYADYVKYDLRKLETKKLMPHEVIEKIKIVRALIRNFETYKFKDGREAREMFNKIIGIYN